MGQTTYDIVQKLWNLCHVLRDDGVTYHQYVNELTFLLFLKMAEETGIESQLPEDYKWKDLTSKEGVALLAHYRLMLIELGKHKDKRIKVIFANASTSLKMPKNLNKLISEIDALDWFSAKREGLGDLYEGLLEKNAGETKSGAGQYFTPRALINSIVHLMKPQAGEAIQDPAVGTGGFLIAADLHIKNQTDELFALSEQLQLYQRAKAFYGVELVLDTHRLAIMNLLLHDIDGEILAGDTLSSIGAGLPPANLILSNPPFGTKKGGGKPTRTDFTHKTSNKQLAFLQHIYRNLKKGGRAAVILPDNVLFEDKMGRDIRADLMEKCNLHTVLRLPTGIFYAQGVKTNVLFFTKGEKKDVGNTKNVWFYDLRTNMPSFGKRTPFTRTHLKEFEEAFGDDSKGQSPRQDLGEQGRFRCFTREQIKERNDNLDISWLRDDSIEHADDLAEPDVIAAEIMELLQVATGEMKALSDLLGGGK